MYHCTSVGAELLTMDEAIELDDHGNRYAETLAPDEHHKLILDHPVPPGYCARLRVYVAGAKKAVIDQDTDLLTPEEFRKHTAEVAAAVLEELKVWTDHRCVKRRPRAGPRNVLDRRWVGKWKWARCKDKPDEKVRVIRRRLTLRGLKEADANSISTCAGTSGRGAQRLIVSEAAVRGWRLGAYDVKKAFLKGVS